MEKSDLRMYCKLVDVEFQKQLEGSSPGAREDRESMAAMRLAEVNDAFDQAVDDLCDRYTKRESERRYRCTLSGKLFLEPQFVRKHILTKHGHLVDRAKSKALSAYMYHYYLRDPKKDPPAAHASSKRASASASTSRTTAVESLAAEGTQDLCLS